VLQSEWDLRTPSSAATGVGVEHVISIDRSGLLGQHHTEEAEATEAELAAKSKHTPMVDELRSQIKIRGALSMSDYIFQCLQNQQFGYYTANPAASVIGGKEGADEAAHGDFITSPELGQVFGEVEKIMRNTCDTDAAEGNCKGAVKSVCMLTGFVCSFLFLPPAPQLLGVWVLQVWEQLGKPAKFQLVEFGPGKGTLMQDVLRVRNTNILFASRAAPCTRPTVVAHSSRGCPSRCDHTTADRVSLP
jgi:NADH dehydrogenase [ubiquinone] 1 alpha subcomplex assembly factor 7